MENADIDRAGDHGLQGPAAALVMEHLEREAVLLEEALLLADLGDLVVEAAAPTETLSVVLRRDSRV